MVENFPEPTKELKFEVKENTTGSSNSYLLSAYYTPGTF